MLWVRIPFLTKINDGTHLGIVGAAGQNMLDRDGPQHGPVVVVAEWLRRWTRNPLGSPRAGSNPADYVDSWFLSPK